MVYISAVRFAALLLSTSLSLTTASSPEPISISPGLPQSLNLPPSSTLIQTWDHLFPSLAKRATALTSGFLSRQEDAERSTAGVPGTAIKDDGEAQLLQDHLDCHAAKGEWRYEPHGPTRERSSGASSAAGLTVHKQEAIYASCDKKFHKKHQPSSAGDDLDGSWHVRESLKWRWHASPSCAASAPAASRVEPQLSRRQFCELLAHKSILMAGDTPQFGLHDLLLDWTSARPQSCYGDLYCKEHPLCADVLAQSPAAVEAWAADERVYDLLPEPEVGRHGGSRARGRDDEHAHADDAEDTFIVDDELSPVTDQAEPHRLQKRSRYQSPSEATSFRYRRTDGLRYSAGASHPTFVHPATGVREVNQLWLADSRRSDVVIIAKSPLPLPVTGINATWDAWWSEAQGGVEGAARVLEAAWRITEDVWLPELIDTLKAVRGPPSPQDQLVVYRGSWRAHADCAAENLPEGDETAIDGEWDSPGDGPPPHRVQPTLDGLLFRSAKASSSPRRLTHLHTLFFNLQVVIQNHLVRTEVLPKFGIPFLDLETPLSVWRSGMVGGSVANAFSTTPAPQLSLVDQSKPSGSSAGLRSAASGDCTRYCLPSPGMAIEEAFIGGLLRVFARGWAGSDERAKLWVGDGFTGWAAREKERAREEKARKEAEREAEDKEEE